ncbi:hypothetical protein V6S67_19370 [Arthrobacter sp. Soc17.1.1.1]|uniref:hypothetical protein n=1 Tax=Arthrobacter sp. Soc17.1.1.1 TaxID=3121277 RepID=UPI002FE4F0D2
MDTTDYSAHPTLNITLAKPFSESLSVHVPQIPAPGVEDMLEDRIKAEPVTFSHPDRVDLTWTPAADKDLFQ